MVDKVSLIGFGEAAQAFAPALTLPFVAFDRKTAASDTRSGKIADYRRFGADWRESAADAMRGANATLSLVTADQALAAARASAGIAPQGLWFDMNSVAPQTKREAAAAVHANGGRFVDVAVLAPVEPKRTAVPLLLSGPHAKAGKQALAQLGFTSVEILEGPVGAASAVKMIRSVMIKGIEALSCECALAAEAAGVRDQVIASLDASWPRSEWATRFDYNLDRMMVHGTRRAAEMDEVIATLDALGTGSAMSRATSLWQREIGALGLKAPAGLDAKLERMAPLLGRPDGVRAA